MRRFEGLIAAGLQATIKCNHASTLALEEQAALTRPNTLLRRGSAFSLITCFAQKYRYCSILLRFFFLSLLQDTQRYPKSFVIAS